MDVIEHTMNKSLSNQTGKVFINCPLMLLTVSEILLIDFFLKFERFNYVFVYVIFSPQSFFSSVKVVDLVSNREERLDKILEHFSDSTIAINLINETEAASTALPSIRFQWDGYLSFKPVIEEGKDKAGNCSKHFQNDVKSSESFHVIQSKLPFNLTINVRQLLLYGSNEDSIYCGIVSNSTKVTIENYGEYLLIIVFLSIFSFLFCWIFLIMQLV